MSIESKIPVEELNIKNLSLEQPESKSKSWKDVFSDMVTKDEIPQVKEFLETYASWTSPTNEINFKGLVSYLAKAKTLYPELEPKDIQGIEGPRVEEALEKYKSLTLSNVLMEMEDLAQIKLGLPDKFQSLGSNIDEKMGLELVKRQISQATVRSGPINSAYLVKVLHPNLDVESLFTSKNLEQIKAYLERTKRHAGESGSLAGKVFLQEAARFKLLFPKEFEKLDIANDLWQKIFDLLHSSKTDVDNADVTDFITIASNLKILLADKAKITDRGIECDFKQANLLANKSLPVPETKKF